MPNSIEIKRDDLSDGQVIALLQQHRQEMLKHSPPENVHALDIDAMHASNIRFWSAHYNEQFAACAAFKRLSDTHLELKSMKTSDAFLHKGVAKILLQQLIQQARQEGITLISLETGTQAVFEPACNLYRSMGFKSCGPFSDYVEDPHSQFLSLTLRA